MASKKIEIGKSEIRSSDGRTLGPYRVGDVVVIRAIPYHYLGRILAIDEHGVTLAAGAVWLADSARWGSDFLQLGKINEAEPYVDDVYVPHAVIADVTRWGHEIPGQL